MILLEGHSLTPKRKIRPEALNIKLTERDSSATLTPDSTDGISTESWLKSDNEPGNGEVWRVKSIQQAYHTNTPVIQLEHAINTLRDRILFGEITPATITGTVGATTCTARQAITYILNQQSDWVLDDFDFDNVSNPYKFDGDTLLDALETVSGTLQDAWWSYDFSVYPFKISITEKSDTVACELRPGRNLRTLSKTIDRGGMFTRFYPIGKDNLKLSPTPYVSKNENLFGVIAKVETDQSIGTTAELTAWANEKLDRHAEPEVTITAEGYELSDATGESLDHLQLGTVCRIPLSEFSTMITERITELNWPDAVHAPEDVKVTLANKRDDATKIIAEAMRKSGRSARAAAKKAADDNAWFEDTNDHVAMCAKGIIGVDASGNPNWIRMSEIYADGNGIHQHVQSVQGDLVVSQASVEINESMISQIVSLDDNRPIKKYDKAASFPATGSASYLYYSLADHKYYEWTNGAYSETTPGKELNRAGIISTINQDGSSTSSILGDKIYIGSVSKTLQALGSDAANKTGVFADYMYVHSLSANDLTTILANIGDAEITSIDVTDLTVEGDFVANGGTMTINSDITAYAGVGVRIGSGTYHDIKDFIADASVSGNTLTLTKANGTTVTFSKTATPVLSGSWSSGTLTVTSTPSATANYKRTLVQKGTTWNGNTASAAIYAQYGDSGQYEENTGWSISVDASSIYTNGRSQGWADSYKILLDSGNNHANDWWNCRIYNSSGTLLKTIITDQANTGLYIPFVSSVNITSNGTYQPSQFTSDAGHTAVMIGAINVNVPTGSTPNYSVSFHDTGRISSSNINSIISGWNATYISGVKDSAYQEYRYIRFKVDGKYRCFYFS